MSDDRSTERGAGKSRLVMIAILVAVVYALAVALFAIGPDTGTPERSATRTTPTGSVDLATAGAAGPTSVPAPVPAGDKAPGRAIYNKACIVCHATRVTNAPRLGDRAAWEPRLAQGIDSLLRTAIDGKGAMPPRGACMDCSDDDLKLAIEYMLGLESTGWPVLKK